MLLKVMNIWWRDVSDSFLFVSVFHLRQGNVFQDAVFNQTVTVTEKEDGLDGETYVKAFLLVLTYRHVSCIN